MAGALGPEASLDKQIQTGSEQTMHLHFSKVCYILLVPLAAFLVTPPLSKAQTQAANESFFGADTAGSLPDYSAH